MKTIIISDINNTNESIIPYGLQIGKYTETEVDIVHIIDPRENYGVPSNYADSQSITPGQKLTHEEMLNHEENRVCKEMDNYLSREESRLNYPLKVNRIIEVNEIGSTLHSIINKNPNSLIVCNSNTDHTIFNDINEMLSTIKELNAITLIVPPAMEFQKPKHALLLTDYERSQIHMENIFRFFEPFNTQIDVYDIPGLQNSKIKSESWLKGLAKAFYSSLMKKLKISVNNLDFQNIQDKIKEKPSNFIVAPYNKKDYSAKRLLTNYELKELINGDNNILMTY